MVGAVVLCDLMAEIFWLKTITIEEKLKNLWRSLDRSAQSPQIGETATDAKSMQERGRLRS